ncbi:MAG: GNAT family N-acetyltransferase, partial [Sporichthyaceae bacterium]
GPGRDRRALSAMIGRVADASVRPATDDDAPALARIQAAVWARVHADRLPAEVLEVVGSEGAAAQWRSAVTEPPSPRHRVLTALAGERVVGFAALAPASDPDTIPSLDGELLVLCVDPSDTGAGHGSRLVNAVADLARIDGVRHLHSWLADDEADLRAFLVGSGWAADGATRSLDLLGDDAVLVQQSRLRTALVDP